MAPIGQWVMPEALEQAARWRREYAFGSDLTMTVNCASSQFGDSTMLEDVRRLLAEAGVEPDKLVLELTETAFFRNLSFMVPFLRIA